MPTLFLDKKENDLLINILDKIETTPPFFGQNLKAYLISVRTADQERESKSAIQIIDIES